MSSETLDQPNKQNEKIDIKPSSIKFGLIGGFVVMIISLILFFIGLQFEDWAKWISTVFMCAIIILGIKSIKDENQNKLLTFGTLFKAGMLMTFIIAIFSVVYFFVYTNFIETNFTEKILDISRQQMAEKGLSEDQIQSGLEMTKKFISPTMMAIFSLLGTMFFGILASLLGAGIYKNEK